jgi:hypothetical protein
MFRYLLRLADGEPYDPPTFLIVGRDTRRRSRRSAWESVRRRLGQARSEHFDARRPDRERRRGRSVALGDRRPRLAWRLGRRLAGWRARIFVEVGLESAENCVCERLAAAGGTGRTEHLHYTEGRPVGLSGSDCEIGFERGP